MKWGGAATLGETPRPGRSRDPFRYSRNPLQPVDCDPSRSLRFQRSWDFRTNARQTRGELVFKERCSKCADDYKLRLVSLTPTSGSPRALMGVSPKYRSGFGV